MRSPNRVNRSTTRYPPALTCITPSFYKCSPRPSLKRLSTLMYLVKNSWIKRRLAAHSHRSQAFSCGISFFCRLMRISLFTLRKHSCRFESDSYICSGKLCFQQHQWNCHRLFAPVNLCISASLRSPPDLSASFSLLCCDPDDPHQFRENSPPLSASWGHTEAHRGLEGSSATSVLISSDIRVSPQSLWSRQDELMEHGLFIPQSPDLSHSPTAQEY